MEKCHLRVKLNQQNENRNYMIMFCEDNTIAKPNFIKNPTIEHTIQSRWITPCRVIEKSTEIENNNDKYYNAYYHPLAYQLAKNIEFRRIIIENAIENVSIKKSFAELSYNIVSEMEDIVRNYLFTKPRYNITIFSSVLSQQKFIQLFIWLPFIISSNSIIIETSRSHFYLQTEKPHQYELSLSWPTDYENFRICFCNFLKKEKQLIVLAECLDSFTETLDDNFTEDLSNLDVFNGNESILANLPTNEDGNDDDDDDNDDQHHRSYHENSLSIDNMCDNDNNVIDSGENITYLKNFDSTINEVFYDEESVSNGIGDFKSESEKISNEKAITNGACCKPKTKRVRFNSLNHCLIFQENKPVNEVNEKPVKNVPMKTNDGCSAKKFYYHMNKISNSNRDKSSRSKRNNNKKKNK